MSWGDEVGSSRAGGNARLVPLYSDARSSTGRLSDEAYLRIREMLMNGEIPPASRVREATIAKQLGMSRTPARDGLRRLEAEGLIKEVPHQGYVVVDVGPEELKDIYQVRSVLEGLAAEQAALHATRADLAVLEDLMEAMEQQVALGDSTDLPVTNREFHKTVARASRNAYLIALLDDVDVVSHRFRRAAIALPTRRRKAHQEHEELLVALRARDPVRARALASEHAARALNVRLGIGTGPAHRQDGQSHDADRPPGGSSSR